jgi:hypothetical protein
LGRGWSGWPRHRGDRKRRGMGRATATEANPEANPGGGQARNPLADRPAVTRLDPFPLLAWWCTGAPWSACQATGAADRRPKVPPIGRPYRETGDDVVGGMDGILLPSSQRSLTMKISLPR